MKKSLLIISILIIGLAGCSGGNPQLNLLSYPERVTPGENFMIESDYLTEKPGDEQVKVNLTVRRLDNDQGLITREKTFTNQSQTVSFSKLNLEESESLGSGLYFELKLIVNGEFKQKITTDSESTLVANWHKNIVTTYFKPAYDEAGNELPVAFGNYLTEENPYYFALPYSPGYNGKVYQNNGQVKDWWVEIYYSSEEAKNNYVYAQWEDVGPWNVYDPYYVFGTNEDRPYAETGLDMGWTGEVRETNGAGLDISPAAISYLVGGTEDNPDKGKIKVNWRFIEEKEVPQDGPWWSEKSDSSAQPANANYTTNTLRTNN